MYYVGKINKKIYSCITKNIITDDVVITDERIQHIKDHHPEAYEIVEPFLQTALDSPDYILEDKSHINTGLILKTIEKNELRLQIVLRVHTSVDTAGHKNSIISAWQISESRWNNYLKNKKILYKNE